MARSHTRRKKKGAKLRKEIDKRHKQWLSWQTELKTRS